MKKLLFIFFIASISLKTFADCSEAYRKAANHRFTRNAVLIVVGSFAVGAAGTVAGASEALKIFAIFGFEVGAVASMKHFELGPNNTFAKINRSLADAQKGVTNKFTQKIVKKAAKKANLVFNDDVTLRANEILAQGHKDQTFCPLLKIKKNGDEKRAVFTKKALTEYLAANL